jgi:hypothetical protein
MRQKFGRMSNYLFNFAGHGVYGPNGKVTINPVDIAKHNKELAQAELEAMRAIGRALLYTRDIDGKAHVGTWDGSFNWPVSYQRSSWHNMAGKNGRTDFWFTGPDGKQWHGVNIGDNQIVRTRRIKS